MKHLLLTDVRLKHSIIAEVESIEELSKYSREDEDLDATSTLLIFSVATTLKGPG